MVAVTTSVAAVWILAGEFNQISEVGSPAFVKSYGAASGGQPEQ